MKNKKIKIYTGIAILIAIEIIFQIVGNLVTLPGGINLNLSLIPIAIAAIFYGPIAGSVLGFANGLIVIFSPSTQAFFMAFAPIGTVITCLLKCTLAGFISGVIFKLVSKKSSTVGAVISSLCVPLVNTLLFLICCFTLLLPAIKANNTANADIYKFVFLGIVGWNFIIEFSLTAILSPSIFKVIKIIHKDK